MPNSEMKERFIKKLADFLAGNQAGKGVGLEVENFRSKSGSPPLIPWAREWAELRAETPVFGYPTVAEAEKVLRKFLS